MAYRALAHTVALVAAWVIAALLTSYFLFGKHGLPAYRRLEAHLIELETENRRLQKENQRLMDEILYRQSDVYLEEMVRNELRQVRDDEILILLPTPTFTQEVFPGNPRASQSNP